MDPQLTVYPRYYVTRQAGNDSVVQSNGDAEIIELYFMYMNRTAPVTAWAFQQRVFAAAHRLFGRSFADWLSWQQQNPQLGGFNFDYLNDTLRYLHRGERQLRQETWFELLSELGDGQPAPTRNAVSHLHSKEWQETAQVLQAWCRRPHGFEDLVCTLNVFFGKSRRSNK